MNLPLLDGIIVVVLFAGLIYVGYWARKFTKSVAQFTIAGREMGMWLGLSTGAAEGFGLVSIAMICQLSFTSGFSFVWLALAVLLLANVPLFGILGLGIKRYRATKVQTLPQYYEMRYDRNVRIFAGITLALGGVLNMAIFPVVGSQFLIEFLSIPNIVVLDIGFYQFSTFHVVLFCVLALSVFFTMISGMVGLILTDYIQSVLIFVSLTIITILILKVTGIAELKNAVETHIGDAAFNPLEKKSIGPVFIIAYLLGTFVMRLAFPPSLQKLSAAESPEVARKMFLLGAIFGLGRTMIIVLWGIAALALFSTAVPEGFGSEELYHRMVGARLVRELTDGIPLLKGIALTGFIAAFISTIDSYLLSWAAVIANDCICAIHKKPFSHKKHVSILRWCSLGIAAFIFLFGCWYDPKQTILQYFYITGAIFGACGLLTWLGLYWKRASSAGAWACLATGLIIPISWFIIQQHCPTILKFATWINNDRVALAGFIVPAVAMVVISLLSKKPTQFVDFGKKLKEIENPEKQAPQTSK